MNSLAFIASVVGSLAIPVTILVALFIFRRPLVELLGRIVSYEGLGQKVSFGQKLAGVEKSVSEAVAQVQDTVEPGQLDIDLDRPGFLGLAALATSNPSFVVIKAWEDLENALEGLVETVFPGTKEVDPARRLPDLVRAGQVNESFPSAVLELRELRNSVAYGQHNPTAGEALTYLQSAQDLMVTAAMVRGYVSARNEFDQLRNDDSEH